MSTNTYTNDFDKLLQLYEIAVNSHLSNDIRRRFDLVYSIADRMIPELLEIASAARDVVDGKDGALQDLTSTIHKARHVVV